MTTDLRQTASDQFRASLADGQPLNARQLGERHGRSRTWGRTVIAEVMTADHSNGDSQAAAAGPEVAAGEAASWVGWLTVAAVLAVAAAAAVASVDHLAELARIAGTSGWRAWLLPVAVDGLATSAALTLYGCHRTGRPAGVLPWAAMLAGLAASVVGNVASVYPELFDVGQLKIAVGATPPLSLALAVELALRQVRVSAN